MSAIDNRKSTIVNRRGTVLVVVMVLVALSAMVAATLLFRMKAEISASAAGANGEQAYAAAMSGLQQALAVLRSPDQSWQDNPELFQNQLVCDDGANKWYFTIYAASGDGKTLRYGLESEAGKVNLNTASEATLRAMITKLFPAADADTLVDSLLDWREPASKPPRAHGAKQEYYDSLKYPYLMKGGPLGTLDELLLVKGYNAQIVYGEDANLNGILDPNEDDGDKAFPPDNSDGQLDLGLMGVATVVTHEMNVDSTGQPRININGTDADLRKLAGAGLSKETIKFITTYRQEGNVFKHPAELLDMEYKLKKQPAPTPGPAPTPPSGRGRGRRGSLPPAPTPPPQQEVTIKSAVGPDELPAVLDKLTSVPGGKQSQLAGLVDINNATADVLSFLPGFDDNLAKAVVDGRPVDPTKKSTIAWLYTENLVSADKFKQMAPYLTARSYQYRVRCMGFGSPCGRIRVIEAIVDLAGATPRIAYMRDITRLGLPAPVDVDQQGYLK
ncbi:MAG: hypothetical protein ACE15C_21455 [Phycisphaerae bacterium]